MFVLNIHCDDVAGGTKAVPPVSMQGDRETWTLQM